MTTPRYVKVRDNSALVILDDQGRPYIEARPYYTEGTGPAVEFYRVGGAEPEYQFTLRLPSINALVRKLPIVLAAAKRLQARAEKPAK
jgi:hypothetical protein